MNAKEIVKTFITALQSGAIGMAAQYMTEDFKLVGWMAQPLDRDEFLALQAQLDTGMPDFSYNLSDLQAHGNTVTGLIQIAATHTRHLEFPQYGIPATQDTGQTIGLPQVPVEFVLSDDKIAEMKIQAVPGGGMQGLLQQLGYDLATLLCINQLGEASQ